LCEKAWRGQQDVFAVDEAQGGLGGGVGLDAEAVDRGVFYVVEDEGWAQVGLAELKTDVLQGDGAGVASVKAIRRDGAEHEVLAGDLRKVAPCGVLCGASASEGEMDVVEGDVFDDRSTDGAEGDGGALLAGVVTAGDSGLAKLRRVGGDGAVDVAEGDIADDGWIRRI